MTFCSTINDKVKLTLVGVHEERGAVAECQLLVGRRRLGGVGGGLRDGAVLPEDEEVVGLDAVDGHRGGRHVDAVAHLHRDAAAGTGEPTLAVIMAA